MNVTLRKLSEICWIRYPDFQFSNLPHTSKFVNTAVNLMIRHNPLDCRIHCYLTSVPHSTANHHYSSSDVR